MPVRYEAFMRTDAHIAGARRIANRIAAAQSQGEVIHLLQSHTYADVMKAFPFPGGPKNTDDAKRYFAMVDAMTHGSHAANEAYLATARNFRPVNGPVLTALRGTTEGFMHGPDAEQSIPNLETEAYETLARGVVQTVTSARLGIARGGSLTH